MKKKGGFGSFLIPEGQKNDYFSDISPPNYRKSVAKGDEKIHLERTKRRGIGKRAGR